MSRTYFQNAPGGTWEEEQIDVEGQLTNSSTVRNLRRRTDRNLNIREDIDSDYSTNNEVSNEGSYTDNPELICGCCLQMMLLPTTLPCGHSFCRLCLANWYFNSLKKSCPIDNRLWATLPKVSVTLKNLEETLFPEALRRRQAGVDFSASVERLVEFEKKVATRPSLVRQASVNIQQGIVNPRNIVYIGGVIIAIILAWRWSGNTGGHQIIHKEVMKWNTEDVETWLNEQGPWAKPLVVSVWKNRIDGYTLLTDDKEMLTGKFGINDTEKENVIWRDIIQMRRNGYKPIKDVWEYKARWPERLIRYSCLFGCSPRLTLLAMYFLDYEDGFLPFYNTVFKHDNSSAEPNVMKQEPNSSDLWWIALTGLVFPYHMFSVCARAWCSAYVYTYALLVCFECVTGEVMLAWDIAEKKTRQPLRVLSLYIKSFCFFITPWTWLPSILVDISVALVFFPVPLIILIIGYSTIIYKLATERNRMDVIHWLRTV